jgi:hypothetical protein
MFSLSGFRNTYPAFRNVEQFSDIMINSHYFNAQLYMSESYGGLEGDLLDFALQLLTAHLLYSFDLIAKGQSNALVNSATIDAVTVSLTPPPAKSGWEWWLSTTPYGLQLWSLLQLQSAGGWVIGGYAENKAFRKAGGVF